MTQKTNEKLISLDELTKYLGGVGRSTIYRHIKSLPGFPQPVKVGAATRFLLSDVQEFIVEVGKTSAEDKQ